MAEQKRSGIGWWIERGADKELLEFAAREEAFDRLSDWEKIAVNNSRGVDRIVHELQIIRWAIILIGVSTLYLLSG